MRSWVDEHTTGYDADRRGVRRRLGRRVRGAQCGVAEDLIRGAARRIAAAASVAVFEDLGIQMNRHSTLNSWLEKLVWC